MGVVVADEGYVTGDPQPHLGERLHRAECDEIVEADIDILLLGSEPFPFSEGHAAELASATGIHSSRVYLVDGEYLSWYGSRTPDGIDYAERVIERARESLSG